MGGLGVRKIYVKGWGLRGGLTSIRPMVLEECGLMVLQGFGGFGAEGNGVLKISGVGLRAHG